ncbi:MAG TPA: PAS domain S-box protein, partial [Deltaproteobacteria bacterium]|nr:PAS domain S-box protein [Deltaproteobacteria bacterium]
MARRPTKADLEMRILELEREIRAVRQTARQFEESYHSLFAHSLELFFIHDFEGRFLDANDRALDLLGYTRDEIPGINLATVLCPEDFAKATRLLQELHDTGSLESQKPAEYRLRTKDGRTLWVETSSSVIFRDNVPYAVQGIARDITERKQAEETLRLSEERHRKLLEDIEEGYYELDLRGNITYFNDVAGHMLGYEPHELVGMSYRSYTSADTAQRMFRVFHRIYETGEPERLVDYEVICRDGSVRTHEMSAGLMRDASGRPSGFHVLVHDITSRKQAQEELKKREEHYRTIFENTGNATILIAEDTTILLANTKFEQLTGYTKEEMEGKMSWTVFIAPEDLEMMKSYHARRRKEPGSTPGAYEFRLKNRAGEVRDIFLNVALIPGTKESVASCMDLTERKRAEEDLRRSEERYRNILESMQEAYYEVDLAGNFTFYNPLAVSRLGYRDEELRGMNFRKYMDEENAKKVFDAYHRVFVTGEPLSGVDWELFTRDGRKTHVEASVSLMRDAAGGAIGFKGIVRDVTERKKAEDALRASEEKYRGILESMQESYFEVDLSGNFTFFNDAAVEMSGYSREELLGMNYTHYAPPETARYMFETFHDVYVTGVPKRMVDYQVYHKDGTLHDNELSVWPMRDASGAVVGFHTLVRDVTEHKRAEKALAESEARYRFLTENMGDISFIVDLDMRTTYVSPSVEKILGFTPEERMRQTAAEQLTERSLAQVMETLSGELARDGHEGVDPDRSILMELEYFHKDGSVRYLETNCRAMRDSSGRVTGIHGVSRDVTDRRKAEAALRESEEKYRTILETMDEAYFELDLQGNYTFVNASQCRILGYPREELLGMNNRAYTTPETARRAYVEFNEVYRTGATKTLADYEVIRKDGTVINVEFSVSPLRRPSGEIIGFSGVGRDVTDRILAEKTLKESERKYRLLAENLRDVIWVLDADLKYVYVSPSVMQLRGYTPEEAMQQKMEEVLAPESYRMAVELFTQEKLLESDGQVHGKEWTKKLDLELIRKDGSTVWTEVTLSILYDENGSPEGLLGITHDISERRKAAEALRESEERWQFALEGAGDGVWDYDIVAGRVYRSRRWKEMLGYADDEISDSQMAVFSKSTDD